MKGRNGVCWPSSEQFPVTMNACSLPTRWRNFMQQALLAHARLGHDVNHAKLAAPLGEGTRQLLHFALAADIDAEAAPDRRIESRRAWRTESSR
jgi:hypothetical protein